MDNQLTEDEQKVWNILSTPYETPDWYDNVDWDAFRAAVKKAVSSMTDVEKSFLIGKAIHENELK
jgi:hypothetical protein